MQTYIYKTSVNIGYVIDYVIKERKSLNGADIYIYIYILYLHSVFMDHAEAGCILIIAFLNKSSMRVRIFVCL